MSKISTIANCYLLFQVMEEDLRALQWEHEVLEQRFEKIQSERDELYTKFVKVGGQSS